MILAHFRAIARTVKRGADGGAVPPGEDLAENSHALRLAFYRDVLQWGMVVGACSHTPSSNFSRLIFRSAEHTSELQSLMRISYAVFCLKIKSNLSSHTAYY